MCRNSPSVRAQRLEWERNGKDIQISIVGSTLARRWVRLEICEFRVAPIEGNAQDKRPRLV